MRRCRRRPGGGAAQHVSVPFSCAWCIVVRGAHSEAAGPSARVCYLPPAGAATLRVGRALRARRAYLN